MPIKLPPPGEANINTAKGLGKAIKAKTWFAGKEPCLKTKGLHDLAGDGVLDSSRGGHEIKLFKNTLQLSQ
jgi:hypothetical protein